MFPIYVIQSFTTRTSVYRVIIYPPRRATVGRVYHLKRPIHIRHQHNMATARSPVQRFSAGTGNPHQTRGRKIRVETGHHSAHASSGQMLNYRQLMKHLELKEAWNLLLANEFGRLFQGIGGRTQKPTNTCFFIDKHQVPPDKFKDVTYCKFVCSIRE